MPARIAVKLAKEAGGEMREWIMRGAADQDGTQYEGSENER